MDEINKVLKPFLNYDFVITDKSSDGIYVSSNHLSDKSNYYLTHIDEFAENVLGVKLTFWQKRLLRKLYQQHDRSMIYYPNQVGQRFIKYIWMYSQCLLKEQTHFAIVTESSTESKTLFDFIKQISDQAKDEVSVAITTPETHIKFNNGSTITIVKPSESPQRGKYEVNNGKN